MTDVLIAETVAALARGHALFAGDIAVGNADDGVGQTDLRADAISAAPGTRRTVARSTDMARALRRFADTDRGLAQIMAAARTDRARASTATRMVLEAAKADATHGADTPLGRREAMARMAARLRAQHRHIAWSRSRSRLLALRLRRLRYLQHRRQRRHHAGHLYAGGTGHAAVSAAIRKALDIKGIHDPAARGRWERGMELVAHRESNYDAGAVNNWDVNAANGTPSKGAWQFIAPTFAAYHEPGTSSNIHDLVAQACAFINYARGHYGVLSDATNLADRIQQADPRRAPRGY